MQYAPYDQLFGRPNVIVDGSATDGTVLTLSHWPHSGTPASLKADLSAEIAFRFLDEPSQSVWADLVSNNHLDEDGVVSVYALVEPEHAQANRELLIEAARLGDFSSTHVADGARLGFAITKLIEYEGNYEGVLDALPGVTTSKTMTCCGAKNGKTSNAARSRSAAARSRSTNIPISTSRSSRSTSPPRSTPSRSTT
jgi:uncharacterized protein DUF6687